MIKQQNIAEIRTSFTITLSTSLIQSTSLPFIKHTLAKNSIVSPDEEFQSVTIGGSVCQSDRMRIDGAVHSLNHHVKNQPPFLSDQDFLSFLETCIEPAVSTIALNFAYPMTPVSRGEVLDGILVSGSKENTFSGMVGKPVGKTIEDYFLATHHRKLTVSVANDTICLLLSGLTKYTWNEIAAGIVGTGMNFAIFLDEQTAVNLESSNFSDFEQSPEAQEIDAASSNPGKALFEKEISGAYLYKHYNILARRNNLPEIAATEDLDEKARTGNEKEKNIAQQLLRRSAQMTATQVAGILNFQKRELKFIMQGSLFWKGYGYKETVEKTVQELTDYQAEFIKIDHADLLGAAQLVV